MALPTASDNPFPSLLITEGTEPAAPAAGKQRLYIDSTTHKLKRTDSSGTDVDIESAGGAVPTTFIRDTTNAITLNSTTEANFPSIGTLTIAAATSDILAISFAGRYGAEAVNAFLDVATIVSSSPVNYVSGGAGDSDDFGISGWLGLSGVGQAVGGTVFYTVQAGDISGGNVVLRLRYRTGSASNKTMQGGAGGTTREALFFGVVNNKH